MASSVFLKLVEKQKEWRHYSWQALMRVLRAVQIQTPQPLHLQYYSNPHLSFAAREIQTLQIQQQQDQLEIDLTLNFLGLQGASTPLPLHFTEAILQDDPDDSNLNAFYNFFNQQFYKRLAAIDLKYAYLPQMLPSGQDALTQKLAALAGFVGAHPHEKSLLPFLNSLVGVNLAKDNWCRMIAGFIGAERAWIAEYVPKRLAILQPDQAKLGQNSKLGVSFSLGAYITQAKNHLELHFSIAALDAFLPDQLQFQALKQVVQCTLPENGFVSVVLHARQARTAYLAHRQPIGLGWSSKLGQQKIESYSVKLQLY